MTPIIAKDYLERAFQNHWKLQRYVVLLMGLKILHTVFNSLKILTDTSTQQKKSSSTATCNRKDQTVRKEFCSNQIPELT